MLITRTPLRITLGGGGTDLPSYYTRFGGTVISAAITKHIYIGINRIFAPKYSLKYSQLELVDRVDQIQHPILREAIAARGIEPGIELVSLADIPSGTGLGSSGSFTVGVLRGLFALNREHVATATLAEEACRLEIDQLGRPVGKQDQYIAAFGGLTGFDFCADGTVKVSPLRISSETLHDLEERLLLFFTGYARDADQMLADQRQRSENDDEAMLNNLHQIAQNGRDVRSALENGDVRSFANLMNSHWARKRERSAGMTNSQIDQWYEIGMEHGALGGKLVGAGGGGFLMFYAEDPHRLRAAMNENKLPELHFHFDLDGSQVIVRD